MLVCLFFLPVITINIKIIRMWGQKIEKKKEGLKIYCKKYSLHYLL